MYWEEFLHSLLRKKFMAWIIIPHLYTLPFGCIIQVPPSPCPSIIWAGLRELWVTHVIAWLGFVKEAKTQDPLEEGVTLYTCFNHSLTCVKMGPNKGVRLVGGGYDWWRTRRRIWNEHKWIGNWLEMGFRSERFLFKSFRDLSNFNIPKQDHMGLRLFLESELWHKLLYNLSFLVLSYTKCFD